ncbi:annexin A7 [Aphelenchoides avenae]|nr:annexin A7 [Aphelenchus avenae]
MAPHVRFDAKSDAALLRDATTANNVDDDKILTLLCSRASMQRQEIAAAFKNAEGRNLSDDLHACLTGESKELAKALLTELAEFDAECLRNAIIDQRSNVVVEILCTRTASQVQDAEDAYKAAYGRELRQDLELCQHVHDKKLILKLCEAPRLEGSTQDSQQEEQVH